MNKLREKPLYLFPGFFSFRSKNLSIFKIPNFQIQVNNIFFLQDSTRHQSNYKNKQQTKKLILHTEVIQVKNIN